jgi:hypothetical protein
MRDATPNEKDAMQKAGNMGGEYLDSIKKTDLATLTSDEWTCFVECVCTGYTDAMRELRAKDMDIPF